MRNAEPLYVLLSMAALGIFVFSGFIMALGDLLVCRGDDCFGWRRVFCWGCGWLLGLSSPCVLVAGLAWLGCLA